PEVRGTFISAAIAGFAGFAVMGLFTALSPRLLSEVLGVRNHAVVGLVVFIVFASSTVAQIGLRGLAQNAAVNLGCAGLVLGTLLMALALWQASFPALIAGAVVAGVGQGMSFSKGLAAITSQVDPARRAEVASTFFVVLYVALALPVIGLGFAVQAFGITSAGIAFTLGVAALALIALGALIFTQGRQLRSA
ncbi:MAG: MFS transporter, partial [Mycobacteriaceae bacterium]